MLYPNLRAEMSRNSVRQRDLAKHLGKSKATISYWMSDNDYEIGFKTCVDIKRNFFPDMSIEYLFDSNPQTLSVGEGA